MNIETRILLIILIPLGTFALAILAYGFWIISHYPNKMEEKK